MCSPNYAGTIASQANEIGVAVKDGVVTLTGTVDTYLNKWKAEEAAHRVSGVIAVANDITVRTAPSASAPIATSRPPQYTH